MKYIGIVTLLGFALSGCAGSGGYSNSGGYGDSEGYGLTSTANSKTKAVKTTPIISVETDIGSVAAARSTQLTLYTFAKDLENSSVCYDACAAAWPPFFAKPQAVATGDVSVIKRKDGRLQWAMQGQPLYFWAGDKKIGDTSGDSVPNWKAARL